MSMPPPNMPLPPNEDRGDAAIAVFWTLTSIATVIVAARFYARWLIRGIGLDDWMILVSLVSNKHITCPSSIELRLLTTM